MRMYHVTNVPVKRNKRGQPKNQPDWEKVEVHVADDKTFDGKLVALPVACFTTTLYKGDLPTTSPYPRYVIDKVSSGKHQPEEGTEHWRVVVPFNLSNYKIFKMAESSIQIHLLCLDRKKDADMLLADILMMSKITELTGHKDLGKYFPIVKGIPGPNEYGDKADPRYKHMFVNVSFINPVAITKDHEWTCVKRDDKGHGKLKKMVNDQLLYAWGEEHIQSSWQTCNESLNDSGTENLEQIKWFMSKGRDKILQQWGDACKSREEELAVDQISEVMAKTGISDKPSDK